MLCRSKTLTGLGLDADVTRNCYYAAVVSSGGRGRCSTRIEKKEEKG